MTKWIERYRREAEQRYRRLDAVLVDMHTDELAADSTSDHPNLQQGAAS